MKIYLAGKITGDADYRQKFAQAEQKLLSSGYTVLSPAILPEGMEKSDYMRICLAMIDCADMAIFLPDSQESAGAQVEREYCRYIDKFILDLYPQQGGTEG